MVKKNTHTIAQIARLANVSESTVSRALNDSPLISQETKDRIQTIARKTDFHMNLAARRLRLQQSRTIAFIAHPFNAEFSIVDLFILEIMGGISNGLSASGYDMLVVHIDPYQTGWIDEYLDTGRVDGFILLTSTWKQQHIQALKEAGAPFIVWGVPLTFDICSVSGDNFNGGKLATEYLLRAGRRRIAFLGGPAEEPEIQLRFSGYEAALQLAGMEVDRSLCAFEDYANSDGIAILRQLLHRSPDLDAVFAYSDYMAIAVIKAIHAMGRRVPDDIAVVGYDDLSIAAFNTPPLTTIRQNIPLAGKLLAQGLIQYLQSGKVVNTTIPVELIVRESA